MLRLRYALAGSLALLLVLAAAWLGTRPSELERERAAYTAFVNDHIAEVNARPETDGPPGADSPGEANEFEFLRTMDPATRSIPYARLTEANRMGDRSIARQLSSASLIPTPTTTTPWAERGPTNIGGRTRAIMWDPNVADRVWAGGVSGGLWSTADITTDGTPWVAQNDFWANLAVTAIAFDPTDTNTFYVGTGEGFFNADAVRGGGIFQSTDGGATFSPLASTDPGVDASFAYVQDVVVTPAGTVLAATRNGNGVQRSADDGATWTPVLDSGSGSGATTSYAADLEVDANGDIYAAMGIFTFGGIWKSTDDGLTWTQQTLPFPASGNADPADNYQRIEVCTAPANANIAYAFTQRPFNSGAGNRYQVNHAFKTIDGGVTWLTVTTPSPTNSQAWYDMICAIDPNDPAGNLVYFGVAIRMYRSLDGGATWTDVDGGGGVTGGGLHPDHHALAYRPGSSTDLVFGHDGGIDYTANANAAGTPTYVDRNDGYNITQYYGGDLSPTGGSNVIVGGTQDNATHYLNSSTVTAAGVPSPLSCCDGAFTVIDQDDANFAVGQIQFASFFARSFDGGQSYVDGFGLNGASSLFIPALAMDDREDLLYQTRGSSSITRISNLKPAGATPTITSVFVPLGTPASTFAPSPFETAGTSTVFIGTSGGRMFRVTGLQPGGTVSETDITGTINPGYISSIEFGADEMQLLVTVSNYGVNSVYESLDGGATWTNKDTASLPDIPIRWAMYNPNNRDGVLLATESGLWESTNFTDPTPVWVRVTDFPTVRVDQLQTRSSDDAVLAITHGRGMWTATWTGAALPVELTAFGAIRDGDTVELRWETASETANAGFSVEARGPEADAFAEIGFVDGTGTTDAPQSYTFRTDALDLGTYTFRLRQVDLDGTATLSEEVEMTITLEEPFRLSQPFPNPLRSGATLSLGVQEAQTVRAALYDATGRQVAVVYDGEVEADRTVPLRIDARGLAAGTYLLRVEGEAFAETRRLTVVR